MATFSATIDSEHVSLRFTVMDASPIEVRSMVGSLFGATNAKPFLGRKPGYWVCVSEQITSLGGVGAEVTFQFRDVKGADQAQVSGEAFDLPAAFHLAMPIAHTAAT